MKYSKINLLVHSYELFLMKENETIVEMITRFTDIVNGLEVLGKTYKESEKGDEDLEVTPIKVAYKGHRNSKSKRLDQVSYGETHRVINHI